jgi:hypothetical protein
MASVTNRLKAIHDVGTQGPTGLLKNSSKFRLSERGSDDPVLAGHHLSPKSIEIACFAGGFEPSALWLHEGDASSVAIS